jgi:hypothetical protein
MTIKMNIDKDTAMDMDMVQETIGYRIPPHIAGSNIRLSSISFVTDIGLNARLCFPACKIER